MLIREKKRKPGERTTRSVPLSPFLTEVMTEWLKRHPGGPWTFCHHLHVARSKKHREAVEPLTRNEANSHFEHTFIGSKWEKLRGWHVLRHSFASNCAARGVPQYLINEWMGHSTKEMEQRIPAPASWSAARSHSVSFRVEGPSF